MKTHPIIFSTPMVHAILEWRKTMTRRVVKPQPYFDEKLKLHTWDGRRPKAKRATGAIASTHFDDLLYSLSFKKYQPGDVLWVREAFAPTKIYPEGYIFKQQYDKGLPLGMKWKPSIHMPKAACRIFLEVTSIRVERLHDITEEDAKMEGIKSHFSVLFNEERFTDYLDLTSEWRSAITSFQSLWAKINGINSWDSNPFVWVIEFKRIDKPENF